MRHAPIRKIGYNPPPDRAGEVEVGTIQELVERAGPGELVGTRRLDFHLLIVVTEGAGHLTVDFADHDLRPGNVLWVRPGQVHQWRGLDAHDGWVLLFPAGLLDPATAALSEAESPAGARWWSATEARAAGAEALARTIADVAADDEASRELRGPTLTHLLAALLLRLTAQASSRPDAPRGSEAWLAFRDLLEAEHTRHHDVAWYAARLGWSTRTLARATRAATGRTPKELVDERVLLEARRLLAHSDLSVARVGEAIGFDDASNFGAWFRLRDGRTPAAFRSSAR